MVEKRNYTEDTEDPRVLGGRLVIWMIVCEGAVWFFSPKRHKRLKKISKERVFLFAPFVTFYG